MVAGDVAPCDGGMDVDPQRSQQGVHGQDHYLGKDIGGGVGTKTQ